MGMSKAGYWETQSRQALDISKEITNTYFKRLSLEKPNILGRKRIKKKRLSKQTTFL